MKTVDKARLAFGRTGAAGSSALRGPRAIARLRTSALFWRGQRSIFGSPLVYLASTN